MKNEPLLKRIELLTAALSRLEAAYKADRMSRLDLRHEIFSAILTAREAIDCADYCCQCAHCVKGQTYKDDYCLINHKKCHKIRKESFEAANCIQYLERE